MEFLKGQKITKKPNTIFRLMVVADMLIKLIFKNKKFIRNPSLKSQQLMIRHHMQTKIYKMKEIFR